MASEVAFLRLEGDVEHLGKLFEIFEASRSPLQVISSAYGCFSASWRTCWALGSLWKLFGRFLERLGDNVVAQSHVF